MRLENKVAVVTGGTGGIGWGVADAFSAEGADVLVTGLTPSEADAANRLAGERSIRAVPLDVADASAVVVRDTDVGPAELERAPQLQRVVRIDPGHGVVDAGLCESRGICLRYMRCCSPVSDDRKFLADRNGDWTQSI